MFDGENIPECDCDELAHANDNIDSIQHLKGNPTDSNVSIQQVDGLDTSMEDSFDDQEPMNADIPLHDENVSYF